MATEYKQVSSPTSFAKKGKMSKMHGKEQPVKIVNVPSMYEPADIGAISPSERNFENNQYAKTPKQRKKQGMGDVLAEMRTKTYNLGKYWRFI